METRQRLIVTGPAAVAAYLDGTTPDRDRSVVAYAAGVTESEERLSEERMRTILENESFEFPETGDGEEVPDRAVIVMLESAEGSEMVEGLRVAVPEVALVDCSISNSRMFTYRLKHDSGLREFTKEHNPELYQDYLSAIEGDLR